MSDAARPGRERNFGLDLARAAAVLLVMVSHWANNIGVWYGIRAPQKLFFAGDAGVDLFFALSGFLIGRILLGIVARGARWRALGTFLVRRWMRTLPLYFLWLAVLALAAPPAAGSHTLLLTATLLQNFAWPMPPRFFFAVSWSLTIEEWFYLGFATALVAAAMLFGRARALLPVLAAFLLVPLALRIGVPAYRNWSNGLWHSVIFRLDAVAYGVALARLWHEGGWLQRHPTPPLVLGLLLIAGTWSGLLLPPRLVPALIDTTMILGAVLCLPALMQLPSPRGPLARLIAAISAQSYALYLVHLTILVDLAQHLYFRHLVPRAAAVLIALLVPFVLSWLSYRFIEGPVLSRRPRQV